MATSTFLVTTTPIWVALLSFLVLRERIGKNEFLGIVIAIISAFYIFSIGRPFSLAIPYEHSRGEGFAMLGAICIAVNFMIGRKLRQHISLEIYTFLSYTFAALVLALYCLSQSPFASFTVPKYAWVYLICLAIGPQLIGHTILNWGIRNYSATLIATLVLFEPVIASLLAWLILNESISLDELIGFAGIFIGVFVATRNYSLRNPLA